MQEPNMLRIRVRPLDGKDTALRSDLDHALADFRRVHGPAVCLRHRWRNAGLAKGRLP
ncbi:hypothetical protein GCM10025857_15700 [Alicyclobacillus contaminans]|nr:hypothetical protein GCM10025857_15700 [Alicyclobacillus contaminans]